MEKATHIADMRFCFSDYREDIFNESTDCTFAVWCCSGDGMSIELYHSFCRQFAAALGFSEDTIDTWFGGY